MTYRALYESWKTDPEAFWMNAAKQIDWDRAPTYALDAANAPLYQWYPDAMVNTCYNAVDRHVLAGRGAQAAIIYDSPITGQKDTISYSDLRDKTARLAGALQSKGVTKGDRAAGAAQMMENYRLFGAPHVAIVTSPSELGAYGAMDTGGFVTAFCLAAQSHGVATIPQAAIAAQAPFVRRYFDIPKDRLILCAISFGYADSEHPANSFRTERAVVDDVMDWRA